MTNIPDNVIERILADPDKTERMVRLAYEVTYEGRLKEPNTPSFEFVSQRMLAMQELFEEVG